MRAGIDRRAMSGLSGGHLAVDFASGSVPALIPFMTDRFDLELRPGGDAAACGDGLVFARPAALRAVVRPARRALADPGRNAARGRRRRRGGDLTGLSPRAAAGPCGRPRRCSVPSRGRQVRVVRERAQEGERHVVLQQRRERRLRARRVRDRAARRLARSRRGSRRDGAGLRRRGRARTLRSVLRDAHAGCSHGSGSSAATTGGGRWRCSAS